MSIVIFFFSIFSHILEFSLNIVLIYSYFIIILEKQSFVKWLNILYVQYIRFFFFFFWFGSFTLLC